MRARKSQSGSSASVDARAHSTFVNADGPVVAGSFLKRAIISRANASSVERKNAVAHKNPKYTATVVAPRARKPASGGRAGTIHSATSVASVAPVTIRAI